MAPTTAATAVRAATEALAQAGVPSPEPDAVTLLAHVWRVEPGEARRRLLLDHPLEDTQADAYAGLVEERARRVPLQHLTGEAPFRHLTLRVGPGVFVPRPETEQTAQHAIDAVCRVLAERGGHPVAVDLCTGSGAIALALATECPAATVHAVELSPEAHAWAQANVRQVGNEVGVQVDLRLGDATTAFEDLAAAVDVVVSNPPYIPTTMEPLDPEVRDHDPQVALYGGDSTGLAIPVRVAERAAYLLRPGGVLVMEHADSQGESLPAALRATGLWREIVDHPDLAGRPRTTVAVRA